MKDFLKSLMSYAVVIGLLGGWYVTRWPAFLYFYGLLLTISLFVMAMIPLGAWIAFKSNSDKIVSLLRAAKAMVDTMNKRSIFSKAWGLINVIAFVSFFAYFNLFVLLTIFLLFHALALVIRMVARAWVKGVEDAAAEDGMTLEEAFKKIDEEAAA